MPGADGDDRAACVRERRARRGSASAPPRAASGRRARGGVVAETVQADVQQSVAHVGRPLSLSLHDQRESSGSRLAPPTSAPSISGCAMKLPDVARLDAAAVLDAHRTGDRVVVSLGKRRPDDLDDPPASAGSALRPVPIAQIGLVGDHRPSPPARRRPRRAPGAPARALSTRCRRRRAPRASPPRRDRRHRRARTPRAPSC